MATGAPTDRVPAASLEPEVARVRRYRLHAGLTLVVSACLIPTAAFLAGNVSAPIWGVLTWVALLGAVCLYAKSQRHVVEGRNLIRETLAAGFCPACEYSVSDVPSKADGRTICPECGAAWRIEANKSEPLA